MKILIVDDDPGSHETLRNLLSKQDAEVELESAYTIKEGVRQVNTFGPELLFLDIDLPDGKGFDLLEEFPNPDFQLIFITAHDKYAITAIGFGALDYLLKPITQKALSVPFLKAQNRTQKAQLDILRDAYQKVQRELLPVRIAVPNHTSILYLEVADIIRLEASGIMTLFYLNTRSQPVVSSNNIGTYDKRFSLYPSFVRVHRSHMINLDYVVEYRKGDRLAILKDGTEITVSKNFMGPFLDGMENL